MPGLLIKNIGTLVSGDINRPILDADAILVADAKIAAVGKCSELESKPVGKVIDAAGKIGRAHV